MSIVSNTGPLIALAKAELQHLLKPLFGQVRIPQAVARELFANPGDDVARLDAAAGDFLHVDGVPPVPAEWGQTLLHLGAGEQPAICLAVHLKTKLMIDDR